MEKITKTAFRGVFLIILFCVSSAWAEYEILLNNGSVIRTGYYYEDGEFITYQQYGGYISIRKSSVQNLREAVRTERYENVVPDAGLFEESGDHTALSPKKGEAAEDRYIGSSSKSPPIKQKQHKVDDGSSSVQGILRPRKDSQFADPKANTAANYLYAEYNRFFSLKKNHCGKKDYKSKKLCSGAEEGLQAIKYRLKKMGLSIPRDPD